MGRLFGTNGVRGVVGEDMTVELALKLGKSLGSFLEPGDKVLVGSDTRTSGPALKSALISGLLSAGADVRDAGVVPTPSLQYTVKHGDFAAGAIVTASHNPPKFNGIKFVDHDGTEFPPDKEAAVEDNYFDESFRTAAWDQLTAPRPEPGVNERYVDAICQMVDAEAIREANLRVVIDTSNGAGGLTAPALLRKLGVRVVTMNCQPDGTFPGHDSEPTPENVKDLVDAVTAFECDLGVVQDGDADRCVFVDEQGTYLYGDKTLALVGGHIIKEQGGGTLVTPVSTSSAVEEHIEAQGGDVVYTAVGSPIVARKMMEIDAAFGGEENGGLIFPDFQHCRDGSMTLAKIVEILAKTGRPMSALVAEVPTKALQKLKTRCPNELKQSVLDEIAERHSGGTEAGAEGSPRDREGVHVDTTDGVKIHYDDGWVLIRPSGTEPIFRVYAEADEKATAERLGQTALKEVESVVGELERRA